MQFKTETVTVTVERAEYVARFRNIEKFLGYCRECPNYNRCYACPPHDFDVETVLEPYQKGVLIGTKILLDDELRARPMDKAQRDKFIESLIRDYRARLDEMLLALEKTLPGSRAFFGGTCCFCPDCAKKTGQPCRFPEKRRCSLESIGFDMAATTRQLLNIRLQWSKDQLPPYFTLVSALFF